MKLSMKDQGWFKQVQAEWHQRLQPHSTHLGAHLFDVPDKLSQTAVDAARLFADRVEALSFFQKGGRVAELGTQAGWYAHRILTQLAPRDLHLFDLDFSPLRIDHPEMLAMPNVTIHEGDSSSNLRKLSDHYFDWIYIDGDHELEGVEKDAAVALRKIKPDGILVFNDYTPWSILELSDYGVMPVVNSLCNQGWKIVYFALHRQMYCDIAIQRA